MQHVFVAWRLISPSDGGVGPEALLVSGERSDGDANLPLFHELFSHAHAAMEFALLSFQLVSHHGTQPCRHGRMAID